MSKSVVIFTDGACSGNPGPGGWGAILLSPLGKVRELGGSAINTTNNQMELTAAIEALLSLTKVKSLSTKEISLFTDSKYVIQGITSWVYGWQRNGWKTAEGKEVSNQALWEKLVQVIDDGDFRIDWRYIPGHEGYPGNERCDRIAVGFSKGDEPKLFTGSAADYKVDLSKVPPAGTSLSKPKATMAPVYLSYINGELFRDKEWKQCEARVKGRKDAKFKKVSSPEEENSILKSWGVQK